MGAILANPNLEWCEKKDLEMTKRVDQRIAICVMSQDNSSIDQLIEDVADLECFEGFTTCEDDGEDLANFKPLCYENMTEIKTQMSLHR